MVMRFHFQNKLPKTGAAHAHPELWIYGMLLGPNVQPTLRQLVQLLQLSHNFPRRLETLGFGASAGSKKHYSSVYSLHHLQGKKGQVAQNMRTANVGCTWTPEVGSLARERKILNRAK